MSRERWKEKQTELLATLPFVTPYDRPKSFADPGGDWSEEHAARVLDKPDAELGWWEFRAIFQTGLPLASYQQGVYFAPFAFKHLKERRENHIEYVSSLVWFLSEHKAMLDSDQMTADIERAFRACLEYWTAKFTVIHLDWEACKAKGLGDAYLEYVDGADDALQLLDELGRYKSFDYICADFVRSLSIYRGNPTQSAWYLGYCANRRQHTKRGRYRHSPVPDYDDRNLIDRHVELVVRELVSKEKSPTFWNDVFAWLGI